MTFGYQQGGSFSQHKQALGMDAAASEQMRLKQITEQRKREEKMRAKQAVQSKEVKLRIIKDELNRRAIENRRLESEIHKISGARENVESYDQQNRSLKTKQATYNATILEKQREIGKIKNLLRELDREIDKVSSEKNYSEKTANNRSRELLALEEKKRHESGEIQRLGVEEQRIESEIKELNKLVI